MVNLRNATVMDLHVIVQMLADDELGRTRERLETPLPESYIKAFESIDLDPNNELIVACLGEEVVRGSDGIFKKG